MKIFFKKININENNDFKYYFHYNMRKRLIESQTIEEVRGFLKMKGYIFKDELVNEDEKNNYPPVINEIYFNTGIYSLSWYSLKKKKICKLYQIHFFNNKNNNKNVMELVSYHFDVIPKVKEFFNNEILFKIENIENIYSVDEIIKSIKHNEFTFSINEINIYDFYNNNQKVKPFVDYYPFSKILYLYVFLKNKEYVYNINIGKK